jgi:hypothetical protein
MQSSRLRTLQLQKFRPATTLSSTAARLLPSNPENGDRFKLLLQSVIVWPLGCLWRRRCASAARFASRFYSVCIHHLVVVLILSWCLFQSCFQLESVREECARTEASAAQHVKRMKSEVRCIVAQRLSLCVKRIQVEQLRSALAAADAANAALGEVSRRCNFNPTCQQ